MRPSPLWRHGPNFKYWSNYAYNANYNDALNDALSDVQSDAQNIKLLMVTEKVAGKVTDKL